MKDWSKQRYVDNLALIYFQKMLKVLAQHTSKLPKKVLKNTKNMTSNSCSVRPEKFHPYILYIIYYIGLHASNMYIL